jgi:glycosyltransferase involved in cell wall biosynthesis
MSLSAPSPGSLMPITVIIPVRNEAHNLPRCLKALSGFAEVYVVDSQSTDDTVKIAESFGAKVVQFHYRGGWPKKRQWAMDTLPITSDWILLLDADEVVTEALAAEIRQAVTEGRHVGYHIPLRIFFLGKELRFGDNSFSKLSLFRRGRGRFECRLKEQDTSMADMEVHEHVTVDGEASHLRNALVHHNYESLARYIQKHNEYSNWEAQVLLNPDNATDLAPSFFGIQAQRRRWLKRKAFRVPGVPVAMFFYKYCFKLGFLDGVPGLVFCSFQAIQMFHTKAKIYELQRKRESP